MTGCVYTQYSLALSRVAQRKRAGPITQRSVDRNHPLLRTQFSRILRFLFLTVENGACPGVEPGTSRTRSANHTTRPTGHGIHYINKGRKTWVTVMASDINMIPVTIHETRYMNIVFVYWVSSTCNIKFPHENVKFHDNLLEYFLLVARTQDEVVEWLRRWTANPLGSARVGSNPILVEPGSMV